VRRVRPVIALAFLVILSGGCLTHFAVSYRHRIEGASFTVAPPWIVMRQPGPDGTTELRNTDGGAIRVRTVLDPNVVVPSVLGERFLETLWTAFVEARRKAGHGPVVLVEQVWLSGSTYPTASFRFVSDGQHFTLAYLFSPPRLAIVTYTALPTHATIHIDGFDRIVRSFNFENSGIGSAPTVPTVGASSASPAAGTQPPSNLTSSALARSTAVAAAPASASVSVPIQIVENIILVPVTLNRTQGATFLLDTGAQYTVLTPELADRLGIVVDTDAPTKTLTLVGGQKITVPFVRLPLIEVGASRIEDTEVGIHALMPEAPIVDGLLGSDILGRFTMTVDRAARQLRLEPAKQ
jgi:predicted aspartyl protease